MPGTPALRKQGQEDYRECKDSPSYLKNGKGRRVVISAHKQNREVVGNSKEGAAGRSGTLG